MNKIVRLKQAGLWSSISVMLLYSLFWVMPLLAQSPMTYQAYLGQIGRWREAVQTVANVDGTTCAQTLAEIAAEMGEITAVQMPNGTVMAVNHDGIISALRATPCDPSRADSLLRGICPNQVCPVEVALAQPLDPDTSDANPTTSNSPPVLGTPSADVARQIEELSGEAESGAQAPADAASGFQSAESSGGANNPSGESGPTDSGTANDAANSSGAEVSGESGEQTAASEATDTTTEGGETAAGSESGSASEAEATKEEGGEGDAGDSGATDAAANNEGSEGTAAPSGATNDDSGAASDNGQGGEVGSQSGETAAAAPATDSEAPSATSQPSEIELPTQPERPWWLWLIIGLALLAMMAGAGLLFWAPAEKVPQRRTKAEPETPEEAVDEGRALIAAGNYRGAVRHLFLAALLTLDERNLLPYDKSRTNYELLAGATLRPVIVATLMPVVDTFERVWYGFETVGLAEYEQLAGQIDLLKQV